MDHFQGWMGLVVVINYYVMSPRPSMLCEQK